MKWRSRQSSSAARIYYKFLQLSTKSSLVQLWVILIIRSQLPWIETFQRVYLSTTLFLKWRYWRQVALWSTTKKPRGHSYISTIPSNFLASFFVSLILTVRLRQDREEQAWLEVHKDRTPQTPEKVKHIRICFFVMMRIHLKCLIITK